MPRYAADRGEAEIMLNEAGDLNYHTLFMKGNRDKPIESSKGAGSPVKESKDGKREKKGDKKTGNFDDEVHVANE